MSAHREGTVAAVLALAFSGALARAEPFDVQQRGYPRVAAAFAEKRASLETAVLGAGLRFPPARIFLRGFKSEGTLELWAADAVGPFAKVREFPVCRTFETLKEELGPKRREGDSRVPEGFYHIDRFNPTSEFVLSLGIDYPNASDLRLGERGGAGGDIYLHGGCESSGCLAMTDDGIRELYVAAVLARAAGQARIPVHLFPTRMDDAGMERLRREAFRPGGGGEALLEFWTNLRRGYETFERERVPPEPGVDRDGAYTY